MAHACNSSTGEVEKGKLKFIDNLGYTFTFKIKKYCQSAKQSAGRVDVLPVDREYRKAAFSVCSEWESTFDRKPAIRFLEMTAQGPATAPVLFLISKSAIQLPAHQQEPSAVDNSVCVPQGPRTKLCMLLVGHLKSYYQTKKDSCSTYNSIDFILKRTCLLCWRRSNMCRIPATRERNWGCKNVGRLTSHSLFLTKYF